MTTTTAQYLFVSISRRRHFKQSFHTFHEKEKERKCWNFSWQKEWLTQWKSWRKSIEEDLLHDDIYDGPIPSTYAIRYPTMYLRYFAFGNFKTGTMALYHVLSNSSGLKCHLSTIRLSSVQCTIVHFSLECRHLYYLHNLFLAYAGLRFTVSTYCGFINSVANLTFFSMIHCSELKIGKRMTE